MRRETWNQEKALWGKQVSEIFWHFLVFMASFCRFQVFMIRENFFHLGILQDVCSMCWSVFVCFINTVLVWIQYDLNLKVPYKMRRKNVEKALILLCICHGEIFLCVSLSKLLSFLVWSFCVTCLVILYSHLERSHAAGHFPFNFLSTVFFAILSLCIFLKCLYTILFCYLLIYLHRHFSLFCLSVSLSLYVGVFVFPSVWLENIVTATLIQLMSTCVHFHLIY